ncbi:tRNA uridine-5-carboxymethylaminomethyl(34) synthesis GTPase MnmE [candidate division KSB1 bacterium]|nr:tRNA uridine-5-carboxymethylaminomethyl(34) synthesis GTPase MnmE [candidate division KSB1 bacterium]
MFARFSNTIAAVSTPRGKGGIAVIRISGEDAAPILRKIFTPAIKGTPKPRCALHGWIIDGAEPVDEVIALYFQSPKSYPGEDVVEISCHGGLFITERILELIVRNGARIANPGEFSERAYLNRRMDLAQAEAVADLIQAETEAARRAAAYQLEGRLSERIRVIRQELIRLGALLELELDFSDEDVEFASRDEMGDLFHSAQKDLKSLLDSFNRGRVCREGIRMAIIGPPNVGKSSLLNALVEKERAIVTDIPGTTRDVIEERLDIEGVLFTIMDTAGLRETMDPIEKEGVQRAEKSAQDADLVLWVLDGSEPLSNEEKRMINRLEEPTVKKIVVLNKMDLGIQVKQVIIQKLLPGSQILRLSVTTEEGMVELIETLKKMALSGALPHEGEVLLTRERHRDGIQRTMTHLQEACQSIEKGMSQEFIALDIRGAMDALGEIIGETTAEDILNKIFSDFCIGK